MSVHAATAKVITPRGRGAVATILLNGCCPALDELPLFLAANQTSVADQSVGRIVFGRWGNEPGEEVVLCRIDDEKIEIHCHGGDAAVLRILGDLNEVGCRTFEWEQSNPAEMTLNDECESALAQATTLRTAGILLDQHNGVLRCEVDALMFPEWNEVTCSEAVARLDALLKWTDFGGHLVDPWRVVLAGRPNVGKSSLINALVGFARAIVHDRPGTTRDVVTAETALEGWPVCFADTAGIREGAGEIEAAGIALAREQFASADCRILVFDRSNPPTEEDRKLFSAWPDALFVANKSDLPDAWGDALPTASLPVSAINGDGIDELATRIIQRLVPEIPKASTAVPFTERQRELLQAAREALQKQDHTAYEKAINSF